MPDDTALTTGEGDTGLRLAVAIRAADLGIWEWDLLRNEFSFSSRAKQIFGFPHNAPVTRQQIIDVLHPEDHAVARDQAARGLDPTIVKRDPYRYRIYRAGDRELRWIQAFGEPVFETIGGSLVAVRYLGTLQDITDDVLARERLAQEEARLRLAIEASGVAIWELNLADQTVSHSPELNKLCGFPEDARPTLEQLRSRYAPGERERMEKMGAEARARGETKIQAEIKHLWPDGTEKWLLLRAQVAPGQTGYGGRVIGVLADITEQKRREEQQTLLVSEFKHRIKNSFAIMQSIVSQTLQGEDVSQEVRSKLFARFKAMADAHDLIAGSRWEGASLLAVIHRAMETFASHERRVELDVEDVELSPRAAVSFSLLLHELLTNALKYGALSNCDGHLRITAKRIRSEAVEVLSLEWVETGSPPTEGKMRAGFGTRLVDRVFSAEFGAHIARELSAGGLSLRLRVPLRRLAQEQANA
jgi:PAS domain S-box-containing protein